MPHKLLEKIKALWNFVLNQEKQPRFARNQLKFRKLYPKFSMGKYTYGVPVVKHWDKKSVLTIGAYCSIAKNVQIYLGGNHRPEWITTYPFPHFFQDKSDINDYSISRGNVTIGSDVWLCQNCTILSGVTIGHGSVIANGAVVSKNVEPYSIVAGNPAAHVKWRFDDQVRAALLETAWWEWPHDEIQDIIHLLCSDNIDAFFKYARQRKSHNQP